jgi:signal transduction histidine kinase
MCESEAKMLERRTREIRSLTEVAKVLTSPLKFPDLLAAVMNKLVDVLEPAEFGAVMLWDEATGSLRAEAAFGYDLDALREMGIHPGESIKGKVYADGIARLYTTPAEIAEAMGDMRPPNRAALAEAVGSEAMPRSAVAAPLQVGDKRFGVLVLETVNGPSQFDEDDLPFVQTLADLIAMAVDRARLEAEAATFRAEQEAGRLRTEVMTILSHELGTPLAAIKGYTTALLMEEMAWTDEKIYEFLHLIDEGCNNLQEMIRDILDSSLIDAGQLAIDPQPVRLERVAHEVADEMQHRSAIHRLVVDFPTGFPIIDADPRWIRQVFRNILDNAIKYSPDGGLVIIRGEVRATDVVVSIADQGIGISPEDLVPLFERYFRVKSAVGYHVAGTGLGLPIARAVVEAHGGRIWAESRLRKGTTLSFSLPLGGLSAAEED